MAAGIVLGALTVLGCGGADSVAPVGRSKAATASKPRVHMVQRGDTLYSIAWRYGLDYRQLAAWNGIREPYTIYPGEKLGLVPGSAPSTSAARQSTPSAQTESTSVSKRPLPPPSGTTASSASGASPQATKAPKTPTSTPSGAKSPSGLKNSGTSAVNESSGPIKRWYWPAKGKVVTTFSRSGNKGIDIAGKLGQPIKAASGGKVVYSGSGLIGYGQLIIVKHNKRYLSAYAHNNKVLVREGDSVKGGQRIAEMGRSGARQVKLHFEIRRDGRPIDPMRYLPR
jgi:lipoprotein NlpD